MSTVYNITPAFRLPGAEKIHLFDFCIYLRKEALDRQVQWESILAGDVVTSTSQICKHCLDIHALEHESVERVDGALPLE